MTAGRLAILALVPVACEGAAWLRVSSPHFELLSDAGEKQSRLLLERLETVRHVFLESAGGKAPRLPVRVFQFSSEREFRRFEPRPAVRGFHQAAPDRDYIAVLGANEETQRAVRHEYLHILLSHGTATLPLWLEEGTAELYSTVEMREAGAVFGSPVESHVRALRALEWVPEAPFFEARANTSGMFYAQAWALAHMLNFAPSWRRSMPRFVELIDQGTPALLAFESAFGASPSRALGELRNYIGSPRFATAVIPIPPRNEEPAAASQTLRGPEVQLAQVELLLALRRQEAATKLLDSIEAPSSPELETARGLASLARKDAAGAKEHFLAAMRLGDRSAVPAFEYAMLLRDEHAPDDTVRRYLAEAVGRNPNLAEAHFILGLMAQRQNRHREAIESFERAIAVLPRQSYFWHARALSHIELQQPELARRSALRAAASAVSNAELEMAQAALKLVGAAAAPAASPAKPPVFVPGTWKPREGSATVEGVLEHIDCFGTAARFQVRPSDGAPLRLWVDNPGEILLKDASSLTFTFSCGPQHARRIRVEYDPQSGLPQASVGRITALRLF
jgi:tetratricopeptide (TPR) repeat protein